MKVKLKDLLREYTERNSENMFKPVAVGRKGIRLREDIYSKELASDYSKNKVIFKNTLVVGMGSKQIDIGILTDDVHYSVSPAYHTFVIQDVDPDYLRYLLEQKNEIMFELFSKKGSRQGKTIDFKRWLDFEIYIDEKDIQLQKVRVLDLLSNLIERKKQQISLTDQLTRSRFIELFEKDGQNNQIVQLEEIAGIVSGITKGRKIKSKDFTNVPYMAVSNVKDGYIDLSNLKSIEATKEEIDKYHLISGDILMTEGGDPDKLGRGSIIIDPPKNCIHQNHIFRVRLDPSVIDPVYFSAYLQQPISKKYFLRSAKQTTGIASINMKQLRGMPVIIPSLEDQKEYKNFFLSTAKSKLDVDR